jgi:AcrR family transcriptional regulator
MLEWGRAGCNQGKVMERGRTKGEQRAATTRRLIEVAREFFAKNGYAQTATEEIVRTAGVTRGALYHHFGSKEGLFVAVLDDVQRAVAVMVDEAASREGDPWQQLRAGCHAFLSAALDPAIQQIALVDAPAVLGWDAWRATDAAHSMRLLREGLEELAAAGEIGDASPEAATFLLSGAMNEAALWVARADSPEEALVAALAALDRLLYGLRSVQRSVD